MATRWILLALMLFCTSCQIGLIPCPRVKADRVRYSHPKGAGYVPHNVTASAEEIPRKQETRRPRPLRPALEKVNVEEWDCPKPGMKRNNMPKALKENIRRNRKAFEDYYKNRSVPDSLTNNSKR
jgi:hypothetical protein